MPNESTNDAAGDCDGAVTAVRPRAGCTADTAAPIHWSREGVVAIEV